MLYERGRVSTERQGQNETRRDERVWGVGGCVSERVSFRAGGNRQIVPFVRIRVKCV